MYCNGGGPYLAPSPGKRAASILAPEATVRLVCSCEHIVLAMGLQAAKYKEESQLDLCTASQRSEPQQGSSRLLQPHPQLPLLLRNLELQPLDAVLERLLALPDGPRPEPGPAVQRLSPTGRLAL